jgi:hypothetical protein
VEKMNVTFDGHKLFDEQELNFEFGSLRRDSIEKSIAGLNGVVSIDLGTRSREIKQSGVLRASSRVKMNEKIASINSYMDGNTHTLITGSGEEIENLRVDFFEIGKERISGGAVVADYEIIYTQLKV